MSDGDVQEGRSEEGVEKRKGEREGRQRWKEDNNKKVRMCFGRLEVIDLEGLPHGNSQPEAMGVCTHVFLCRCVGYTIRA